MVSGRAAGKTGFKSKNHNTRLRMVNKEVELAMKKKKKSPLPSKKLAKTIIADCDSKITIKGDRFNAHSSMTSSLI